MRETVRLYKAAVGRVEFAQLLELIDEVRLSWRARCNAARGRKDHAAEVAARGRLEQIDRLRSSLMEVEPQPV